MSNETHNSSDSYDEEYSKVQSSLYSSKLREDSGAGEEALWRNHGRELRQRLVREDDEAGGLTFRIRQDVDINEYFEISDRMLSRFLDKWSGNQRRVSGETEWIEVLESYRQGNRFMKFMTVLSVHEDYYSMDPQVVKMRDKCHDQLIALFDYLEEVALTIDQEEFRKHAMRNFEDDQGPSLGSYLGSAESSEEDSFEFEDPSFGGESSLESSKQDTSLPPSKKVNVFFSSEASHISLLESEEPRKTKNSREAPTSSEEPEIQRSFSNEQGSDSFVEWKTLSPLNKDNKLEFEVVLPKSPTRGSNQEDHTTKSLKELLQRISGDETVATDISTFGNSRCSMLYRKLSDVSSDLSSDEGYASSSDWDSDEDMKLLVRVNKNGTRQSRARALDRFKGCIRCALD